MKFLIKLGIINHLTGLQVSNAVCVARGEFSFHVLKCLGSKACWKSRGGGCNTHVLDAVT